MPVLDLSWSEAMERVRFPGARWPNTVEQQATRLMPIAAPAFQPSFKIEPQDRIFTVGSCFARNLERQMAIEGYDIAPMKLDISNEESDYGGPVSDILNKYVSFSILHEMKWALDPEARFGDEAYFEVRPGRWMDPHLHPRIRPSSLERVKHRRAKVNECFRQLPECRVVVMTLGLAEAWFDTKAGFYLNCTLLKSVAEAEPDRFRLHQLDYNQILASLEEIHALLTRRGHPDVHILITVSPVAMSTTFVGADVLQANTYSKSVQRAAVEAFVNGHDNVDYFPSYESVTLSDRKRAWNEDQAHASNELVRFNVLRMMNAYADRPQGADDEPEVDRAAAALTAREHMEAGKALMAEKRHEEADAAFKLAVAAGPTEGLVRQAYGEFLLKRRRLEEALSELHAAVTLGAGQYGAFGSLAYALLLHGDLEEAAGVLEQALKIMPGRPGLLNLSSRVAEARGRIEEAYAFAERAYVECVSAPAKKPNPKRADFTERYLALGEQLGRREEAETMVTRAESGEFAAVA